MKIVSGVAALLLASVPATASAVTWVQYTAEGYGGYDIVTSSSQPEFQFGAAYFYATATVDVDPGEGCCPPYLSTGYSYSQVITGGVASASAVGGSLRFGESQPIFDVFGTTNWTVSGSYGPAMFSNGLPTALSGLRSGSFSFLFSSRFSEVRGSGAIGRITSRVVNGPAPFTVSLAPVSIVALPEPATWALMILGFGAIGVTSRRKKPAAAWSGVQSNQLA